VTDLYKWVIQGERLVDDTPYVRVSLVDVELPNGARFTQYVVQAKVSPNATGSGTTCARSPRSADGVAA